MAVIEERPLQGKIAVLVDGPGFVVHPKTWLSTIARETDQAFPHAHVTIERGEPVIHKTPRRKPPAGLKQLEKLLALKLTDTHILDLMADVQHWLNWCGCFGPLSGFETKLEDATLRQMLRVFAYGSHTGPAQMARSLAAIHARHIAWIHHEHRSEEKLDKAIGNGGVIPTNNRREMRKYLKYNHLLANIVIFANVALLTDVLNELASEGHEAVEEVGQA